MSKSQPTEAAASLPTEPVWLGIVRDQVTSLRFGTVQIVVHEARVTQIEKIERIRLDKTVLPDQLSGQLQQTTTHQ